MTIDQLASQDFEHAVQRGFWRRILTRLTGENNELLPYDEVRDRLEIQGQHYLGLKQVSIDKIIGSFGRYNDFDRAFLPLQKRTKDRWISIDRAHYENVNLPPVELIKMGDIFFVKDGNHRVSVARERGQLYVDAFVTEIDTLLLLTSEIKVDELELRQAQARFMIETNLAELRPDAKIEASLPSLYPELLNHIAVHRWYLGIERSEEISYQEAVTSWYDNVYLPLILFIREQNLLKTFPNSTETDLYLWIMEYQGYLRQAYRTDAVRDEDAKAEAARQFVVDYPQPAVGQLVNVLNSTSWIDDLILDRERTWFFEVTLLNELCPNTNLELTLPGQYDRIREHISVHRWYLGEQRHSEVSYPEAVVSWCENVYSPIVEMIREQGILKEFPNRTETDLYLWIIEHQWFLRETYGDEIPIQQAAEQFAIDYSERPEKGVFNILRKKGRK